MTRSGHELPPDTMSFLAYPSWQGDTLAFVPHPAESFSGESVVPKTMAIAVQHERLLFHDIATAWASAFPRSPEALEALAVSLELLGDRAALDTLHRARALATTSDERSSWRHRSLDARQVLGTLRLVGLRAARILAESLLLRVNPTTAQHPVLLASLAALIGRAQLAADLSRAPAFLDEFEVPPQSMRPVVRCWRSPPRWRWTV
jgi:hypothetical protein